MSPHTLLLRALSLFLAIVVLFISSCASSYRPIQPDQLSFMGAEESIGLRYSYRYNVLAEHGNKKYANKELKKGVKLVALEIQNTSDQPIILRRDIDIMMGDKTVFPMDHTVFQQQVKQLAGLYMLYALLWLYITKCDSPNDCSTTYIPIGLLIGLINTLVASSANKALLEELAGGNIVDREIKPGESAVGLVALMSDISAPITLRIKR